MYWDVFISHSSNDKDIANKIADTLLTKYYVWYDSWNILPGNDFEKAIETGLRFSRFGIILLSKNFFKRYHESLKKVELEHFLVNNQRNILPIWYNIDEDFIENKALEYEIPKYLLRLQGIKMTSEDDLLNVINDISKVMELCPRKKKNIRRTIKKENFKEIKRSLFKFQDINKSIVNFGFGWRETSPKIAGDEWQYRSFFENTSTREELEILIHRYNTINDAKKKGFNENKNEFAKSFKSGRLFAPNVGEESYGYITQDKKVEVVTFRTSNLLNTVCYCHRIDKESIAIAEEIARIIDRNIRTVLTIMSIDLD